MPDERGHPDVTEMRLSVLFAALADPVRRGVIDQLVAGEEGVRRMCGSLNPGLSKSTMTHHWRVLREAGLIRQVDLGNRSEIVLRAAELRERFPGLLELLANDVRPVQPV
ncbi:MAG TPA: helix-turn-helix domain-containing protein [Pseudonocardiaceae bacterium]|nr:helix-turn-helix domain-containing protein [Pseudonocardiaceae bacterium]